jgi:hypothetical protein
VDRYDELPAPDPEVVKLAEAVWASLKIESARQQYIKEWQYRVLLTQRQRKR